MEDLSLNNYVFAYAGQSGGGITVTIGSNVTKIPANLFYYSQYITNVVFEDDSACESIGTYAFEHCTSLTSITIPNSVTSIGSQAFYGCYKLVEVYNLSSLTITAGSTSNGYVSYYAKHVYTSESGESCLTMQDGYIFFNDNDAYYLMGYIGSDIALALPTLTVNGKAVNYSIYQYAFCNNTKITSIVIPDSVISIGDYAFLDCTSLESVTIGDGITFIGSRAFYNCASLTSITVDSRNTYYKSFDGNLYSYDGTELIQYTIGKIDTFFEIPDSVTSIGSYAFAYCTSLTSIVISDSVTSIGNYAFYNCTSLTSITIPDSVNSIGDCAFLDCTSLESVYYIGTVEEWAEITFINSYSDPTYYGATLYYYSSSEPDYTDGYNYWYYVDGEIVVWVQSTEE